MYDNLDIIYDIQVAQWLVQVYPIWPIDDHVWLVNCISMSTNQSLLSISHRQ